MSLTSGVARNRVVAAPARTAETRQHVRTAAGGQHGTVSAYRLLAWAVLFGALFAWEGLALARVTGVPSLSDVFRVITRYPVGRWALFALWLWAGWHFFIRGWHFLLRA